MARILLISTPQYTREQYTFEVVPNVKPTIHPVAAACLDIATRLVGKRLVPHNHHMADHS